MAAPKFRFNDTRWPFVYIAAPIGVTNQQQQISMEITIQESRSVPRSNTKLE